MQAKDPSDNLLTTRQVCDLIEALVGKRPTADQIREWCRQGYIAPEELPPIHLEHVRNRMGHYEISEESVRRFIEMRRRRENNLLAFVKWCKQRSGQFQTQSGADTTTAPTDASKAEDDEEPADHSDESSSSRDATGPTEHQEPKPEGRTASPDIDEPRIDKPPSPDGDPDHTRPPEATPPDAQVPSDGDADSVLSFEAARFSDDLLSPLVVEKSDEEIEDDFFSTFVEDDQDDDSIHPSENEPERKPSGESASPATTVVTKELPDADLTSPDELGPEVAQQPECDFASFAAPAEWDRGQRHGLRSWRSRRVTRSPSPSRQLKPTPEERPGGDEPAHTQNNLEEKDEFSVGIFETATGAQDSTVEASTENTAAPDDVHTRVTAALAVEGIQVAETIAPPSTQFDSDVELAVAKSEPSREAIDVTGEADTKPDLPTAPQLENPIPAVTAEPDESVPASMPDTPSRPAVPRYMLPPIKPLPPDSPLRPDLGPPRVSSPLRPQADGGKPATKSRPNNNGGAPRPAPRTPSNVAPRTKARRSAQLDQLAEAYAAYTAGAALSPPDSSVAPKTREVKKPLRESPSQTAADAAKPESPTSPEKRPDTDRETRPPAREIRRQAAATPEVIGAAGELVEPSAHRHIETASASPRISTGARPRAAAQASRYLWLWVGAIVVGWTCFGMSFMVSDDFGVIALSSITVAATGMSGLWWTGK